MINCSRHFPWGLLAKSLPARLTTMALVLWLLPGSLLAGPSVDGIVKPMDPGARTARQAAARPRTPGVGPGHPRILLPTPSAAELAGMQRRRGPRKALQVGFGRRLPVPFESTLDPRQLPWNPVAGGQAAVFSVTSPGAASLRLRLLLSRVPAGTEFRFFNPAQVAQSLGPVRLVDIPGHHATAAGGNAVLDPAVSYWSPVVGGETLAVEIFVPTGADPTDLRLALPELSHLVVSLPNPGARKKLFDIGRSGSCNIDVACDDTGFSSIAIGAVAKYIFTTADGWSALCTGVLLNDRDPGGFEPYFLTANHCVGTQSEASTLNLYWFFERASCGGPDPISVIQTFNGGALLATGAETDFTLLNLAQEPPGGVGFAGWTATAPKMGADVTGVHHPSGDLKKISYGRVEGLTTTFGLDGIEVVWSSGTTEGGSSGSGLFDADDRLVGQLYGGYASCSNPSAPDYYGRFDRTFPNIERYVNVGAGLGEVIHEDGLE